MQDADLLVALAGIAGVFVGFGALISIRGGGASEPHEVAYVRMVVWMGLMVIVISLVPVVMSRYGLTGHALWLPCSLLFLVLFWGMNSVSERLDAERRAIVAGIGRKARIRLEVPAAFLWVPMHIALILVVLGLFPNLESALYVTAVVSFLFMDGLILLYLVHSQGARRQPETTRRAGLDRRRRPQAAGVRHLDPGPRARRDALPLTSPEVPSGRPRTANGGPTCPTIRSSTMQASTACSTLVDVCWLWEVSGTTHGRPSGRSGLLQHTREQRVDRCRRPRVNRPAGKRGRRGRSCGSSPSPHALVS